LVGAGVTGLVAADDCAEETVELAARLFSTIGEVVTVETEHQLDQLSAVSGSGPAYVFFFIEKLVAAAERMGFSRADARRMVEGTFFGASKLLAAGDADPQELRKGVTSPNGTTEQAMNRLLAENFDGLFDEALAAAVARAGELAQENR